MLPPTQSPRPYAVKHLRPWLKRRASADHHPDVLHSNGVLPREIKVALGVESIEDTRTACALTPGGQRQRVTQDGEKG